MPDIKILLVEDEKRLARILKSRLDDSGYKTEIAFDGTIGRLMATANSYDIIILDVNLPGMNGYEVCKAIREAKVDTPVIMLTALGTSTDKLTGFDYGADDYIVKPFEFDELVARIKVFLRRSDKSQLPSNTIMRVADVEIFPDKRLVYRSGKKIELTSKEYLLLEYLVKNKGIIVSRAQIAEKIWEITFDTGTNVIDVYVNYLRNKIDRNFSPKLIHTKVGMGYYLSEEEF